MNKIITYPKGGIKSLIPDLGKYNVNIEDNSLKDLSEMFFAKFTPKIYNGISDEINDILTEVDNGSSGNINKEQIEAKLTKLANAIANEPTALTKESFIKKLKSPLASDKISNDIFYIIKLPCNISALKLSEEYSWEQQSAQTPTAIREVLSKAIEIKNTSGISEKFKVAKSGASNVIGNELKRNVIDRMAGVLSGGGVTVIKPTRAVLKDVPPLTLNFEWTFSPKNDDEANNIKSIIKLFKILSMPQSAISNSQSQSVERALLKSPAIWEIQLPNYGKFNNMIVKNNNFPAMVITNIETSFGEEGVGFYKDGMPIESKLSVSFTEYFPSYTSKDRYGINVDEINNEIEENTFFG